MAENLNWIVPKPRIEDINKFLCSDQTWEFPDTEKYFFSINENGEGLWKKGNSTDAFLKGDGTLTTMELGYIDEDDDPTSPKNVYAYLYDGGILHFSNKPIQEHGENTLVERYYLEATSNIFMLERVPWSDRRKEIVKITSEDSFTPTLGMGFWFYEFENLKDISALRKWNMYPVKSLYNTFGCCYNLKNFDALYGWSLKSLENLIGTFTRCYYLTDLTVFLNWDVSKVTGMSHTFEFNYNIKDISALRRWDVSSVKNLGSIFRGCTSLEDISALSNWKTSSLRYINNFLDGCVSLKSLQGLENLDVSEVISFKSAFQDCDLLVDISPIAGWNVGYGIYFGYMFYNVKSVKSFEVLNDWNVTSDATIQMFGSTYGTKPDWYENE